MFFRVPKRWDHCGERLDSAGKNSYLKARMSAPSSLHRFVDGVRFSLTSGASQSTPLPSSHEMHLPASNSCLQKVEYTLGEESEAPGQRLFSSEELSRQLEKLLKEGSSNQRVFDWIEVYFSWIKKRWLLMCGWGQQE